jgi:uncharacterized membrane protein
MFDTSHLHPMVVHFPIAIITVGILADIVSLLFKKEKCLSTMGLYLEVLGVLAALVTVGTGYFLTNPMDGEAGALRERHELFAFLTLGTLIVAAFFRILLVYLNKEETRMKYVAMGIFFLSFVFVTITGYLGGNLVYEYMVGI